DYSLRSEGITTCWIMQNSEEVVNGKTISNEKVLSIGLSLCSKKDHFCKRTARKVSLDRALRGKKAPTNVVGIKNVFPFCYNKYEKTGMSCISECPFMHVCFHSKFCKHVFTKTERAFFWNEYAKMIHSDWAIWNN
ncbi:MAG: hypothetical protein ABID61_02570, partial [Candidatus Micrarchaeota archaeon]